MKKEVVSINTHHIGLDLGSRFIKIALLDGVNKDTLTEGTAIYPAVGTLGDKRYFKSVKENLKAFIAEYVLSNVTISVTLAPFVSGMTHTHFLTIETTAKKILKKAIAFEMNQRDRSDSVANAQYLWTKLREREGDDMGGNGETDILLTIINKQLLSEIAQLRKVRWRMTDVELQTSSISRFVRNNAVVLDFGHESTRVYLYKEGHLKNVEQVGTGGKGVTDAIQTELETSSRDVAEELKHQIVLPYGMLNPAHKSDALKRASDVVADETVYLTSEIKRLIRTFELNEEVTVDAIHYTGGMTHIPNFVNILSDELGYELTPFGTIVSRDVSDYLSEVKADADTSGKDEPEADEFDEFSAIESRLKNAGIKNEEMDDEADFFRENEVAPDVLPQIILHLDGEGTGNANDEGDTSFACSMTGDDPSPDAELEIENTDMACAVATAAALSDVIAMYPELNYQKFLKYNFDLTSILLVVGVLCATLQVGVPLVGGQYDASIETLNSGISTQNQQLDSLNSDVARLTQEKATYDEMAARIEGLESQKKWYSDFLHDLPDKTPVGLIVEHINIINDSVTLDGYARNYSDIGFLAMGLEERGTVDIVEITDVDTATLQISDIVDTDEIHPDDSMTKRFILTYKGANNGRDAVAETALPEDNKE